MNSPGQIPTQLSILHGMVAKDPGQAKVARERFAKLYGNPLREYLSSRLGTDSSSIDDLVQEFLFRKMFPTPDKDRDNFVESYLKRREVVPSLRFRGYLLKSLWYFAIEQQRGKKLPSVDASEAWDLPDEQSASDLAQFDQSWARNLLSKALDFVRDEPVSGEDGHHRWPLFQCRVLSPALTGDPVPSYELLRAKFQLQSPRRAASLVQSAVQSLRETLTRLVREYLPDSSPRREEIVSELSDLRQAASGAGGLGLLREYVDSAQVWAYSDTDESIALGHWSSLLDIDSFRTLEVWEKRDFAGIWNHLLETSWAAPRSNPASLGSLLYAEKPDVEVLGEIRRVAKRAASRLEESVLEKDDLGARGEIFTLPREFAAVLYLLATAVALLRNDQMLSREPEESFLPRVRTALSLPWLDRTGRSILASWQRRLTK